MPTLTTFIIYIFDRVAEAVMSFVKPESTGFKKYYGLTLVIIFHALLAWLLVSGLAREAVNIALTPVEATLVDEIKSAPEPEKPQPKHDKKPIVPKPDIAPPPVSGPAIQAAPIDSPPITESTAAKLDTNIGCKKPNYPSTSKAAGEEGMVILSFLVAEDGKVKESRVDKSSGFKRLDEAAREALSLCQFRAGSENGKLIASWAKIRYVWRLN